MGLKLAKEKLFHLVDANSLADVDFILTKYPTLANTYFDRKESSLPISRACWLGKLAMVELLLAKGADPNKKTKNGFNAIFFAAERGREDIIKFLIEKGCEYDLIDDRGFSPLDVTIINGYYNASLLLIRGVSLLGVIATRARVL